MITTKFHGIDSNPEISLFEYGLLVSNKRDSVNGYQVIYKQRKTSFGVGWINEEDFPINEDWFGKEKFFEWTGLSEEEWMGLSIAHKLYDMISYHGYDDIMGTDYSPFTREEVLDFLKYKENETIID